MNLFRDNNKEIKLIGVFPAEVYLFKINNGNTRTICEICLKLTFKTPDTITLDFFYKQIRILYITRVA